MTEALGDRVRRLRRGLGQSQTELAGSELSASYVSLIEAGRRSPTETALTVLAGRLGTTPAYLLTGRESRDPEQLAMDLRYAELVLLNGVPAEALLRYHEVLDALDPEHDRVPWRSAVYGVALAQERLGHPAEASGLLEAVRAASTPYDRDPSYTQVIITLARTYLMRGDLISASRLYEDGQRAVDAAGNPGGPQELWLRGGAVHCYIEAGDLVRAGLAAEEMLRLSAALPTPSLERSEAHRQAGEVALHRGELRTALDYAEKAVALSADANHDRYVAMMRVFHATVQLQQADPKAAAVLASLTPVLAAMESGTDLVPVAFCRAEVARALLHLGRTDESLRYARLAADGFAATGVLQQQVDALLIVSRAESVLDGLDVARATLAEAARVARTVPPTRTLATLWAAMAAQSEAWGDLAGVVTAQREALRCAGIRIPSLPEARALSIVPGQHR